MAKIQASKYFTLKQVFNVVDGRLSTGMDDVYDILDFVFQTKHLTHQLPRSMDSLESNNPQWFIHAKKTINNIKSKYKTDDFDTLMSVLDSEYPCYLVKIHSFI